MPYVNVFVPGQYGGTNVETIWIEDEGEAAAVEGTVIGGNLQAAAEPPEPAHMSAHPQIPGLVWDRNLHLWTPPPGQLAPPVWIGVGDPATEFVNSGESPAPELLSPVQQVRVSLTQNPAAAAVLAPYLPEAILTATVQPPGLILLPPEGATILEPAQPAGLSPFIIIGGLALLYWLFKK